jgi:hypothetical protein
MDKPLSKISQMNLWGDGNSRVQPKKKEETHAEEIEEIQTKILEEN